MQRKTVFKRPSGSKVAQLCENGRGYGYVFFFNRIYLLEKLGFWFVLVSGAAAAAPLFAFPCFKFEINKMDSSRIQCIKSSNINI